MNPSSLSTDILLANQALEPFQTARIRTMTQSILSFNANTTNADTLYINTTATLVALERTKVFDAHNAKIV